MGLFDVTGGGVFFFRFYLEESKPACKNFATFAPGGLWEEKGKSQNKNPGPMKGGKQVFEASDCPFEIKIKVLGWGVFMETGLFAERKLGLGHMQRNKEKNPWAPVKKGGVKSKQYVGFAFKKGVRLLGDVEQGQRPSKCPRRVIGHRHVRGCLGRSCVGLGESA